MLGLSQLAAPVAQCADSFRHDGDAYRSALPAPCRCPSWPLLISADAGCPSILDGRPHIIPECISAARCISFAACSRFLPRRLCAAAPQTMCICLVDSVPLPRRFCAAVPQTLALPHSFCGSTPQLLWLYPADVLCPAAVLCPADSSAAISSP